MMASIQYECKMRFLGTCIFNLVYSSINHRADEENHIGTHHYDNNHLDAGSDTGSGKHAEKKTVPSQAKTLRLWSTTPTYITIREREKEGSLEANGGTC